MFTEKASAFDAEKDMTAATPKRPPEAFKTSAPTILAAHVIHTAAG